MTGFDNQTFVDCLIDYSGKIQPLLLMYLCVGVTAILIFFGSSTRIDYAEAASLRLLLRLLTNTTIHQSSVIIHQTKLLCLGDRVLITPTIFLVQNGYTS